MTTNRLARSEEPEFVAPSLAEIVAKGNASIAMKGRTGSIEWVAYEGKHFPRWTKPFGKSGDVMDRRGEPMNEAETYELNRHLEKQGAIARYRSDGSRYLITDNVRADFA